MEKILGVWYTLAQRFLWKGELDMNQYDIRPGKYRHYKGNDYEVLGLATHSETLEPMVVYRALYGVRPVGASGEDVERAGRGVGPASAPVSLYGGGVTLTHQSGDRGVHSPGTPASRFPAAAWTRR